MNCDGVSGLLSAYVDGELSAGELLRVEQHLRRCHACADEVDALRQTIALVASLDEVEVPVSFHAQLHERLVALGPPTLVRRKPVAPVWQRNVRRWAVPAAAAAAALAFSLSNLNQGTPPGLEGTSKMSNETKTAELGPVAGATQPPADNVTTPPVTPPVVSTPPVENTSGGQKSDTGTKAENGALAVDPAKQNGLSGTGTGAAVVTTPKADDTAPVAASAVHHEALITVKAESLEKVATSLHAFAPVMTADGIEIKLPNATFSTSFDAIQNMLGSSVVVSAQDTPVDLGAQQAELEAELALRKNELQSLKDMYKDQSNDEFYLKALADKEKAVRQAESSLALLKEKIASARILIQLAQP